MARIREAPGLERFLASIVSSHGGQTSFPVESVFYGGKFIPYRTGRKLHGGEDVLERRQGNCSQSG